MKCVKNAARMFQQLLATCRIYEAKGYGHGYLSVYLPEEWLDVYKRQVVEWAFRCAMTDGTVQSFDGLSLIRWNEAGQICFLQEFGCNENRYDPYAQGKTPVFREEQPLWF